MTRPSRIPIFGLPHKCDVIRRTAGDDGAGGITDEGTPITLYAKRRCRVSSLDEDDDELKGMGFRSPKHRKVVMIYSPQIVRNGEFVMVPWGVPPNVGVGAGAPAGSAPIYTLTHTGGDVTMNWDLATTRWVDESGDFTMTWDGSNWVFDDQVNGHNQTFDDPATTRTQNPWKNPAAFWVLGLNDYELAVGVADIPYRIVWHMHRIDDVGGTHHTSLVIELEDEDTTP